MPFETPIELLQIKFDYLDTLAKKMILSVSPDFSKAWKTIHS